MATPIFKYEKEWDVILKVARQHKLSPNETILLLAMREVEQGKQGFEYGVLQAKGTNLETQAKWVAQSIKANTKRYNKLLTEGIYKGSRRTIVITTTNDNKNKRIVYIKQNVDFITFFHRYGSPTGYGWAPIDEPEMGLSARELNKNWGNNVKQIITNLQNHFQQKGVTNVNNTSIEY